MDPEALITEKEIDGTGGTVIRESIHKNMPLIDPRMDHFKIRYFSFGKYRVGIIEDEDQRERKASQASRLGKIFLISSNLKMRVTIGMKKHITIKGIA